MKEQVVAFGRAESMAGVLTQPDAPAKKPHLLLFNAGFVHHVGPGRLAVDVARHVVNAGFSTFRFDFSGIGDSAPRVPPLDATACGIADAKEAMDHLASTQGADRFVLMGLCSGARHAHHVAVADRRVVGAIMLDGYCFPTTRSKAMGIRERLDDPMRLLAGAKRRAMRMFLSQPPPKPVDDDEGDAFFPGDPTRVQMEADLRALAARKVAMLSVNSGEWLAYKYEGQLADAFREVELAALLTEKRLEAADHLYFTRAERSALLDLVTSWMRERFA